MDLEKPRYPRSVSKRFTVVAIEIGPSFSSCAFSFSGTWKNVISISEVLKCLVPSTILFNSDETFRAFGFEAKEKYIDLIDDTDVGDLSQFYFPDFMKQILQDPCPKRRIRDINGKEFYAEKLLYESVNFYVKKISGLLPKQFTLEDVEVVLVLPVNCSEDLQNLLENATLKTGIKKEQIFFVSSAVAASLFCQHMKNDEQNTSLSEKFSLPAITERNLYIIIHLGEEHTTMTTHLKCEKGIDPVLRMRRCQVGSDCIISEIVLFLKHALDTQVIEEFERECPDEYETTINEFLNSILKGKMVTRIPLSLSSITRRIHQKSISSVLESRYQDRTVTESLCKITITERKRQQFYESTLKNIGEEIDKFVAQEEINEVEGLIFTGELANSLPFQEFLRKNPFRTCKVLIPEEASLVVLKGAVYYGHADKTKNLLSKSTFGIQFWETFDTSKHSVDKKITIKGKEYCDKIFLTFLGKRDLLPCNRSITKQIKVLNTGDDIFRCLIFKSQLKSPKYIDDPTCRKIGQIEVPFPNLPVDCYEHTELTMNFDSSSLSVEAHHIYKNQSFKLSLCDMDCFDS